ncbi:MAG: hypothetical protein M3154_11940 [Candidatus Eremiobacteraeota bacterium]|nr:hypothetical protein [Candidatus Eremiobacteraeota bacterium]
MTQVRPVTTYVVVQAAVGALVPAGRTVLATVRVFVTPQLAVVPPQHPVVMPVGPHRAMFLVLDATVIVPQAPVAVDEHVIPAVERAIGAQRTIAVRIAPLVAAEIAAVVTQVAGAHGVVGA